MSETKTKGTIGVETQNIFPIIKQWLYSDRDIFIRELVSNSFDAINKRRKLDKNTEVEHEINLVCDKKSGILSIQDTGVGMSEEEIQKYINQIASSGAEDFLKKFSDATDKQDIIGHFGLGFYSSFMVSEYVSIETRSFTESEPVKWIGQQDTSYEILSSEKKEVGTLISLKLNSDSVSYLEENTLTELVKKYANFLPVPIKVNGKVVNDQNPLWIQSASDLKDEAYKDFYQKLFPMQAAPLFWIHLNVDYPFRLQGILYFPQMNHELDSSKGKIQLFCQQVFVTENVKEILPEFLTLLQGAIDCPDIPLNVSRSQLQQDPYVRKISKHIVKKISDKLVELAKKDSKNFETYWKTIHPFIKYGMMSDDDFYKKTKDICIFRSSTGLYTDLDAYQEKHKEKIPNQIIYSSKPEAQSTYIDLLKEQNIDVILLDAAIDNHFIQFLESKLTELKFLSVDGEGASNLMQNEEESKIDKPEQEKFSEDFKKTIQQDSLMIEFKAMINADTAAIITENEQSKRFHEMSQFMGSGSFEMPRQRTLVLNTKSPIVQALMSYYKLSPISDKAKLLSEHVYDLALLSQEPLSGEKMSKFITRSNQILSLLTNLKS